MLRIGCEFELINDECPPGFGAPIKHIVELVRPERINRVRIVNPVPLAVPPISIENDADVARNWISLDLPDEPLFICSIERPKSPDRRSSPELIDSTEPGR